MKKLIFYFFGLVILFSCGEKKAKIEGDKVLDLIVKTQSKGNKCELSSSDKDVKATFQAFDKGIKFKVKKKETILSKKVFSFFWIQDSIQRLELEKITAFQKALKAQRLIGISSGFKTIKIKDSISEVFYQEGFDKRAIESNKNREGSLFVMNGDKIEIKFVPKGKKKALILKGLKERIQDWKDDKIETQCLFDWEKTIKTFSTLNSFNLRANKNLQVCYYVNPVSNLLEPTFFYSSEVKPDNLRLKIAGQKAFNFSLGLTEKQKEVISNYSKIEEIDFVLNTEQPRLEIVDTISCLNTDEFDKYFKQSDDGYQLINDQTIITESVIAPKGIKVVFTKGQEIDFQNGGFFLSFSPVEIHGSAQKEVKIYSSDSSGRGFHVINAKRKSIMKFVSFNGLNNLEYNNWNLPSAVTYYESPVEISHCSFLNNLSEDGLNLFRSFPFKLELSTFENTFSDAFDADFSDGIIKNCTFNKVGNDGIDISGSQVIIEGCNFNGIADKALSSGEASMMNVDSIIIDGASLAIVAKDYSGVNIKNSKILNSDVVYCAFQKKKEFGPSKIIGDNIETEGFKEEVLLEVKSSLILDGKEIKKHKDNVKKILYGNEYGKATVK